MGYPPERLDVGFRRSVLAGSRRKRTRRPHDRGARRNAACRASASCWPHRGSSCRSMRRVPQHATLGGTLAAGWLGPAPPPLRAPARLPHRLDRSCSPTERIARAGGMVVKNVAGYDMSRLYVGSFGTLGVIVQANFKTTPLAPARARLFLAPSSRTNARASVRRSRAACPMPPAAAFWIDGFHNASTATTEPEGRVAVLLRGQARRGRTRDARRCARRWGARACPRRASRCAARASRFSAHRRRIRRLRRRTDDHLSHHLVPAGCRNGRCEPAS